jgi:S-DNA-T family DNA segregation ATPase FtsK/SpoIIIE
MPNAVDSFASFYQSYQAPQTVAGGGVQYAAPVQPAGTVQPSVNYASSYIPDPGRAPLQGTAVPLGTLVLPGSTPVPQGLPQPQVANYPQVNSNPPQVTNYGAPNAYGYGYAQGPITATAQSLRGIIKGKDYDQFATQTAPIIDSAIPLIGAIASMFGGNKNATQPPQQQATYVPTQVGNYQATYQQPVYQQPVYQQPAYQQPVYQATGYPGQPVAGGGPGVNNGNNWGVQVSQGIQGIAGLAGAIAGLFKH